jgi:hypothetical protein
VTTSTGTGSVVLSASPTLTGTVAVASLNASVGIKSPGAGGVSTNTAIGQNALATNTTGFENTAVGQNALATNTTGYENTALGSNALAFNTSGLYNTAVGSNTLPLNTTGNYNVAVGRRAMYYNTTGHDNVAIGSDSMISNQTGNYNTAIGNNSSSSYSANNNTAIGYNALQTATADNNTAIGCNALRYNTYGANNTAVGYQAGATGTQYNDVINGNNNTLIGYNATSPLEDPFDNIIVLGNSDITTIYCQVTTISPLSSDARDKTAVETIPLGLEFINQLRPVKYKYDSRSRYENGVPDGSKADDFWTTGFIAQEVMAVQPEWFKMAHELGKDHLTATPGMVLMPLLKAVQELSAQVTALQAQVNSLSKLQ